MRQLPSSQVRRSRRDTGFEKLHPAPRCPDCHVRNRRLYDAIDHWALCALQTRPGARALYDQHRAAGDLHHQVLRALGNRLVGILHGCLRHHTAYSETTTWAHRQITEAA